MSLIENTARQRLELAEDGQTVFCNYRSEGDIVYLTHVEAPPALRGTGAAGRLMQEIIAWAQANCKQLVPVCSYAVHWLQRHKAP